MTGEYQSERNGYVAFKAQTSRGAKASGAGARILPIAGGNGKLQKGVAGSALIRRDALTVRGRHTSNKTMGSYSSELVVGTAADDVYEAVMRGTWAAGATITEATVAIASAKITAAGNTVTFSAGSVITAGVRVGEVHRWATGLNAADIGRNLITTGVTATSITYAQALTTVTVPVASWSFSQPGRSLINPAIPINRYFTIEEAELDIQGGELFGDAMFGKMSFKLGTTGVISTNYDWTGTGDFTAIEPGDGPYFTDPVDFTAVPLSVADATIRFGTETLADMTALEFTFDLGLSAEEVSGAKVSPKVADGSLAINASMTCLRKDLAWVKAFDAETPLSAYLLAEGEPDTNGIKPFFFLYLPNFTLGETAKSEFKKEGKTKSQTLTIPRELVGVDFRGGAFDRTMARIQVSNAS